MGADIKAKVGEIEAFVVKMKSAMEQALIDNVVGQNFMDMLSGGLHSHGERIAGLGEDLKITHKQLTEVVTQMSNFQHNQFQLEAAVAKIEKAFGETGLHGLRLSTSPWAASCGAHPHDAVHASCQSSGGGSPWSSTCCPWTWSCYDWTRSASCLSWAGGSRTAPWRSAFYPWCPVWSSSWDDSWSRRCGSRASDPARLLGTSGKCNHLRRHGEQYNSRVATDGPTSFYSSYGERCHARVATDGPTGCYSS